MNIETENRYIEDLKAEMEGCSSPRQVVDELFEKTHSHDSKACLDLGYILFYGLGGIEENKRNGLRKFLRAFQYGNKDGLDALENMAERGEPEALRFVGRMYYSGRGVEKDILKAVEYFEKGAKLGDVACMESVANCYLKGKGVEKDVSKAIEYYKKAAEQGSTFAAFRLVDLYSEGKGDEKDDMKEVFELIKKEYEREPGYLNIHSLIKCYKQGIGTQKDDGKVFELCKEYYEMRPNSFVVHRLARCYDEGIGTQKDEKKAFELIKESVKKGNRHVYYSLAFRYETGKGTEVDIKEAYKWYLKDYEASERRSLKSLKKMISILEENPGVEKDEDKLKEYKEECKALEEKRNRRKNGFVEMMDHESDDK